MKISWTVTDLLKLILHSWERNENEFGQNTWCNYRSDSVSEIMVQSYLIDFWVCLFKILLDIR